MIKKFFMNGLRAFLPLALTIAVVFWILNTLENIFRHILLFFIPVQYYVWGMGIIAGILSIFALGIVVNFWLGQKIPALIDRLVNKIPLIKTIYTAFKDVSDYFDSNKSRSGSQVVMADLPHLGKIIGIVMRNEVKSPLFVEHLKDDDCCIVYFPMSYQIGGYSIIVSRKNLTPLKLTVEEGLRFAMTAGVNYKDNS
jgi:uncharacterized membrane protein